MAIKNYLQRLFDQSKTTSRLLQSYSYQAILKRGFALVANGPNVITSALEAKNQPHLQVRFSDGIVDTIPLKNKKNKQNKTLESQPDFWSYVNTK